MKRAIGFITTFLMVAFIAAGCATQGPQPTQELTLLQDAVSVRDDIITAKNVLADARVAGKVDDATFAKTRRTLDDADRIVKRQIDSAHNGLVNRAAVDTAAAKLREAKAIAGIQ